MSVTKAQLEETAKQLFDQIDTNKNGALEKKECFVYYKCLMLQLKPDAEFDEPKFEENFAKLDKNSDGKVSYDELLASLIEKAQANGVLAE